MCRSSSWQILLTSERYWSFSTGLSFDASIVVGARESETSLVLLSWLSGFDSCLSFAVITAAIAGSERAAAEQLQHHERQAEGTNVRGEISARGHQHAAIAP